MLYVSDSCAIATKRIYFELVKEDIIGYTKHGGVAIWCYQFLVINKKIVWEYPANNEDWKKSVRFARKREKFSPAEDQFLYGILWFEDLCKLVEFPLIHQIIPEGGRFHDQFSLD